MEPMAQNQLVMQSPGAGRVFPWLFGIGVPTEVFDATDDLGTVLMFLGPPDDEARARIEAAADALVVVGDDYGGAAGTEAYLEAADLYERAGKGEQRKVALGRAASSGDGVLAYAAEIGLAQIEIDEGNHDAALTRLARMQESFDGFLAEDAAIERGMALEHLDRKDEAAKVYADFLANWPQSPRAERVRQRQSQLLGGSAPARAEPAPGAPADPAEAPETPSSP
jgi:tetratricopeptide (TPR) repeat protein